MLLPLSSFAAWRYFPFSLNAYPSLNFQVCDSPEMRLSSLLGGGLSAAPTLENVSSQ